MLMNIFKNARQFSWKVFTFGSYCASHSRRICFDRFTYHSTFRPNDSKTGCIFIASFSLFHFLHIGKDEEEDEVRRVIIQAKAAQILNQTDKAQILYHQALSVVSEKYANKQLTKTEALQAQTYIYDSLADLAFSQGQFSQAETLYKETIRGCIEGGMSSDDNAIVEMSLKLANIYAIQNRVDEACAGYKFCIDIQEKKINFPETNNVEDTEVLLGMTLESYGRFMLRHGQYNTALKKLEMAVNIAKRYLGNKHPQTLIVLTDLALANLSNKNYEMAERLLKEAIETGKEIKSEDVSAMYSNLGAVYLAIGQLGRASQACTQALKAAKEINDKYAEEKAQECLNLLRKQKEKKA